MHSKIDKRFMRLQRIARDAIKYVYRCTQRASFRFPDWLRANAPASSVRSNRADMKFAQSIARKIASGSKIFSRLAAAENGIFGASNTLASREIANLKHYAGPPNAMQNAQMRENDILHFLENITSIFQLSKVHS